MHSGFYRHGSNTQRAPWRRGAAIVLALIIHALLILMLLRLAPMVQRRVDVPPRPISFQMLPEPQVRGEKEKSKKPSGGAAPRAAAAAKPKAPVVDITPPDLVPEPKLNMIILTKEEYAASDLAKLGTRNKGGGAAGTAGVGTGRGSTYGPGEGPGGMQLVDADWYRRPTDAELSTYMPPGMRTTGYGLVACQTAEDNQVENCRELGESPPGSKLARAVRLAAWQFRVRAPKVNGRPQIGAWVRIRIDYTMTGARSR